VTVETALLESDNPSGTYQITYNKNNFTIEPTRGTVNCSKEELAEWIKGITGWCYDVDRLLGGE
jgi:hypothetical protein